MNVIQIVSLINMNVLLTIVIRMQIAPIPRAHFIARAKLVSPATGSRVKVKW